MTNQTLLRSWVRRDGVLLPLLGGVPPRGRPRVDVSLGVRPADASARGTIRPSSGLFASSPRGFFTILLVALSRVLLAQYLCSACGTEPASVQVRCAEGRPWPQHPDMRADQHAVPSTVECAGVGPGGAVRRVLQGLLPGSRAAAPAALVLLKCGDARVGLAASFLWRVCRCTRHKRGKQQPKHNARGQWRTLFTSRGGSAAGEEIVRARVMAGRRRRETRARSHDWHTTPRVPVARISQIKCRKFCLSTVKTRLFVGVGRIREN